MLRNFQSVFHFTILLLCSFEFACLGLNVYISQQDGGDKKACSSMASPCRTISYAYKKAMQNTTMTQLSLIIQGSYKLENTVYLNISHDSLTSLKLASADGYAEVIGGENYMVMLGCESSRAQCIKYSITIEKLIFRDFSGLSAVMALFVRQVNLRRCQFVGNNASAIHGTDSGLSIQECSFSTNIGHCNSPNSSSIGGAVGIVYSNVSYHSINITDSVFVNNSACLIKGNDSNLFDPDNNFSIYGGGISIAILNHSSNNELRIDNCTFKENKALFAGGLSLLIADYAKNNNVVIRNSVMIGNKALYSGGGFNLKTFGNSSSNDVTFENMEFRGNSALGSAGAGKLIFQSIYGNSRQVFFINSTFAGNCAPFDGALGIGSNLRGILVRDRHSVLLQDVSFIRNSPCSLKGALCHTGTLSAYGVDLEFTGNVLFHQNTIGSALFVCGTLVKVNGNVTFSSNIARSNGGAVSLTDGSTLLLIPGSSVLFYKNFAWYGGGAVYVSTNLMDNEVYSFNPICFLQYGKPRIAASKWNVSVKFIENGAGVKGATIFASTIKQCLWIEEYPYYSLKKAFRWSDRFHYSGNFIGYSERSKTKKVGDEFDIATEVFHYKLNGPHTLFAQPGDNISLNITAVDEYNSSMTSSLSYMSYSNYFDNGTSTGNTEIAINEPMLYTSESKNSSFSFTVASENAYRKLSTGGANRYSKIVVAAVDSVFGAKVTVHLKTQLCGPGYIFNSSQLKCVCDLSIKELKWCDGNIIQIETGYWANVSQKDPSKLITYVCPHNFCTCRRSSHQTNCNYLASDPDRQCHDDREGTLCGTCKAGKSITLPSYSCKECSNGALPLLTLIFVIVLVIGVCIAVIYFNPGMSDYLKGIFFYTQILPYFVNSNDIAETLTLRFSTLINSVAIGSMPIEMCLFDGLDLIDAVGLSYAIPLSAAVVLVTVFVLSKYRILNFHRDSPFNAFWILISMAYKFLTETSLLSLACFKVDGDLVFFFDGAVKCFARKHLSLFVPSALILIFIVLPLPVCIVLISYGYIRVPPHISDVIAKGYRTNCRWWCAVDLGRRFLFAVIFIFTPYVQLRKALFIFASLVTCLGHATILPYQNNLANKGETFLLGSLCLIAALQAMATSSITTVGTIIVISGTIIYAAFVVGYLMYSSVRARFKTPKKPVSISRTTLHISPVDLDGKQYNVPKRVMFDAKKAKKARMLREPLMREETLEDF